MAGNEVKLANGQRWSAKQFVDHYFEPSGSGSPVPVAGPPLPVPVDMAWYMNEGPGRFYHPGMFPIINKVANDRRLAPGTYNLSDLVPKDDPSRKATLSNYVKDAHAEDYKTRALVFGNESATISGQVVVNPDGTKTFRQIEIRPFDTNFDFHPNTWNPFLEAARAAARQVYDPENYGTSYDIEYRGNGRPGDPVPDHGMGRVYHPFSDAQLNAVLHKEFAYPGSAPAGLLPSFTAAPPPAIKEHLQYLDQANGNHAQLLTPGAGASAAVSNANGNSAPGGITDWIASLAGVDPANPDRPQQSQAPASGANPAPQRLLPPWVFLGSP